MPENHVFHWLLSYIFLPLKSIKKGMTVQVHNAFLLTLLRILSMKATLVTVSESEGFCPRKLTA